MTYHGLFQHYLSYVSKVNIKNESAGSIKPREPEFGTAAGSPSGRCNTAAQP